MVFVNISVSCTVLSTALVYLGFRRLEIDTYVWCSVFNSGKSNCCSKSNGCSEKRFWMILSSIFIVQTFGSCHFSLLVSMHWNN